MKYTTLLISLAVLLFCCLASINSQRSLYDDVQLLRQVESIQTPTVTFDFQEPDSVDFSCTFYGGKAYFPFEQHTPIPIVYNGVFNFNFAKVKLGDKITFSLSDTVFTLVYPTGASNDQLWDEEVSRWRLQLALSSDYSSISYTDVMKKDSILYESEGQNYFEKVKKAELILFGQELSNRLRNGQYNIDEEVVEGPLQRNPFLGELLFSNRTDRSISYYAPAYRATTDPDIFLADYYQTYPHQRIIDGDSLLDFRQNLALTSTASSYRSQIVTAQDQLRQASTAINENRQRSSGFSATNVAVGLSDFIAERAQEELNLSFFNRFKENLARKSELTVLFPATSDLMFKFEISNYKTFLNFARETFQNDLDNLGLNVPGILNLEKYKKLKNDPNVFNLSLIYSVADLAYREQPVETILLASLQTLQQRREYLNQSISLAITDSMLTLQQNDDRPSPLVQYRDDLLGYLKEIEALDQQLRGNKDMLRAWYETEYKTWIDRKPPSLANFDVTRKDRVDPYKPDRISDLLHYDASQIDEFATLKALAAIQTDPGISRMGLIGAYLTAKLEGRDYHAYRLSGNRPDDFENYYLKDPLPPAENMAIGLEDSREVIGTDYDEFLEKHLEVINEATKQYKTIKDENRRVDNLTINVIAERSGWGYNRYSNLTEAFNKEINFWKYVTGENEENHYIGGLAYLRNQYKMAADSLNPGLLSGYAEVTQSRDTVDPASPEFQEYHLSTKDSTQLAEINRKLLRVHDLTDEYFNKFSLQRQRAAEAFSDRFDEVAPNYEFKIFGDSTADSSVLLSLQYEQFDDYLGSLLRRAGARITTANMEEDFLIDEELEKFINEEIEPTRFRLSQLRSKRDSLRNQLAAFERNYAGDLVDARQNAADMATVLTMAGQLVYALRTYQLVDDSLSFLDTQRVQIIRDLPGGQMIKDSLVITEVPVAETGKQYNSRWITSEEFNALRRDETSWKLFLGLLYQRLASVENGERVNPESVALLATKFFQLVNDIDQQRDNFRRKKAADAKSISFQDYYPFIRSTVDLFNTVITTPVYAREYSEKSAVAERSGKKKGAADGQKDKPQVTSLRARSKALAMVPRISDEALSLYENIFVKNYGNAVLNATELMKILTGQFTPSPENQTEFAKEKALAKLTKQERREYAGNSRGINAVFRYGSFMASMIGASTSDQVRNILRATTLPPGSSRIKREVSSNFTINSYLGAGLGRDRLLSAPDGVDADAFGAALSVPIGLTYSFSPKFLRNNSSFSVHVPLLDLGALTAYRSNSGGNTANINNLPELEWKNLFSPGAYLIYNFADSPFSLGVGGQYGPQLREIVPENGDPLFLNSWRFPMAIFTIDVPFYNLHTGPRKITVR